MQETEEIEEITYKIVKDNTLFGHYVMIPKDIWKYLELTEMKP